MYKIYINDHLLMLAKKSDVYDFDNESVKCVPYFGKGKFLLNYVDKLEKSSQFTSILLYTDKLSDLWLDFKGLYKRITAAGGIVINELDQVLFIDRLNRWDLPKGKKESGEENDETALREVMEETGLQCDILKKCGVTYHTYRNGKGRRVLKKTHWYVMRPQNQQVKVQEEEHIVGYQWISANEFLSSGLPTYNSIKMILKKLD